MSPKNRNLRMEISYDDKNGRTKADSVLRTREGNPGLEYCGLKRGQ